MRSLLLSLTVMPALLALSPPVDPPIPTPPVSHTVRLKVFRDREYGVQVKYPRGWFVTDDRSQGDLRVQFQSFDEEYVLLRGEDIYAAIFVGVSDTVDRTLDEIIEGLESDAPDGYAVERITNDKLGRLRAKRVVSTAVVDGVELTLVGVWAVRGERTYSLMLSVPTADVETMLPLFEKIRKAFIARAS